MGEEGRHCVRERIVFRSRGCSESGICDKMLAYNSGGIEANSVVVVVVDIVLGDDIGSKRIAESRLCKFEFDVILNLIF